MTMLRSHRYRQGLASSLRLSFDWPSSFGLNEYLLEVAADVSEDEVDMPDGLASWIASLSAKEKDRLLVTVAHELEVQVGAALVRRYRRHLAKTRAGVENNLPTCSGRAPESCRHAP